MQLNPHCQQNLISNALPIVELETWLFTQSKLNKIYNALFVMSVNKLTSLQDGY